MMMGEIDQERYHAAADWAEKEAIIDAGDPAALRGPDAQAFTRGLLRRAGGRQPLDSSMPLGQRSPRRQVRLPETLSDQVDDLAERTGRTASQVMREAIEAYVATQRSA